MIKKALHKILTFILVVALISYLVFALSYTSEQLQQVLTTRLEVRIVDSLNNHFVTSDDVCRWLETSNIEYLNLPTYKVPLHEIEALISSKDFVKNVEAYTDLSGNLRIDVNARVPIMRFNCNSQPGFYLTDDNYVLPLQSHFVLHLPIVTGQIDFPFESGYVGCFSPEGKKNEKKDEKNLEFFCNLVKFVKFIRDNRFWNAQIVQIDVVKKSKGTSFVAQKDNFSYHVELVPRAGEGVIKLSSLDNYELKLKNLMTFYHKSLSLERWSDIKCIDLSFDSQVVVSR